MKKLFMAAGLLAACGGAPEHFDDVAIEQDALRRAPRLPQPGSYGWELDFNRGRNPCDAVLNTPKDVIAIDADSFRYMDPFVDFQCHRVGRTSKFDCDTEDKYPIDITSDFSLFGLNAVLRVQVNGTNRWDFWVAPGEDRMVEPSYRLRQSCTGTDCSLVLPTGDCRSRIRWSRPLLP